MSDSTDILANFETTSEALPSADLEAGDVGPITDWEETVNLEAGAASNEFADADAVEPLQESKFSARVAAKLTAKMPYTPDLPTSVNAAKLPGAFFFLTVKYQSSKGGAVNQVVAYDPSVKPGDKASEILAYYVANGLPYYEYFDESATGKWGLSNTNYSKYIGEGFCECHAV